MSAGNGIHAWPVTFMGTHISGAYWVVGITDIYIHIIAVLCILYIMLYKIVAPSLKCGLNNTVNSITYRSEGFPRTGIFFPGCVGGWGWDGIGDYSAVVAVRWVGLGRGLGEIRRFLFVNIII